MRPDRAIVERRPRDFLRALGRTRSLRQAQAESGIQAERLLRLLDESDEFRAATLALWHDVETVVRAA